MGYRQQSGERKQMFEEEISELKEAEESQVEALIVIRQAKSNLDKDTTLSKEEREAFEELVRNTRNNTYRLLRRIRKLIDSLQGKTA